MAYQDILYDVQDRIATITLNRPQRLNAWTRTMDTEIHQAMQAATDDDGVRVIIVTGAGRGFCAGADMEALNSISGSGTEGREAVKFGPLKGGIDLPADFQRRITYWATVPKPIIAAINGPCAGIGLVQTLFADLRFAADTAVFTTAFSRRGLVAEHGSSWMLPRLVGMQNALDVMITGRKFNATEARDMGLVSQVFTQPNFINHVRAYAAEMCHLVSPRSMREMKRLMYHALQQPLAEAMAAADQAMADSFTSEDFKEGIAHFVEKRAPKFTGR
jgi:enoyl-CoA hydratase/carnithine racemase